MKLRAICSLLLVLTLSARFTGSRSDSGNIQVYTIGELDEKSANDEDLFPVSKISSLMSILSNLLGIEEISTVLDITKLGLGVIEVVTTVFKKVFSGSSLDLSPGADRQLLSMFEIITLRLEQIQHANRGIQKNLRVLAAGIPHLLRYEIALDTLDDYVKRINNQYHRFAYYQKYRVQVENHTLLDFAQSVISHQSYSVQDLMANIHSMVSPSNPPVIKVLKTYNREEYSIDNRVTTEMTINFKKKYQLSDPDQYSKMKQKLSLRPSVFQMLHNAIRDSESCHLVQTPQQMMFGLYTLLAVTLARGYAMTEFSYNILKFHQKGEFNIERQLARELYTHYSEGLMKNGVDAMKGAPNSYRTCDPYKHVENETFVMVTELLQGYIENEVDLNPRGSCGNNCGAYQHSAVQGCYLPDQQYCGKHRRCKGTIHDCKFFHADSVACISQLPYRRYDWIKYEDRRMLGVDTRGCKNTMKIDSWWRFIYHCSYCVCLCDDMHSDTSDRFFSLRPAVSDVKSRKVVTGIRFAKRNRVLYMQVQQGQVQPQGQVDVDTLSWAEIDPIDVDSPFVEEDVDFVTLKYERRNVDLDRLEAPKGHAITGVRFRMLGSHLNLEMWVTPINFTTGEMTPELSFWVSNDNTPVMMQNPRREVKLHDPDDPRRSHSQSFIDSSSDTFIKLQQTSLYTDVSQLTVPFLDAQPVSPYPPTWLQGIQMYHRGNRGYGGFISFKTFNYNISRHFSNSL